MTSWMAGIPGMTQELKNLLLISIVLGFIWIPAAVMYWRRHAKRTLMNMAAFWLVCCVVYINVARLWYIFDVAPYWVVLATNVVNAAVCANFYYALYRTRKERPKK